MNLSLIRRALMAICLAATWFQALGQDRNPPPTAPGAVAPEDRRIAPQDTLQIVIVGERDIPTDFPVTASGTIEFPFLGTVEVKGLKPSEAASRLRQLLMKDYFVDPQVLVTVSRFRQEFIRVNGQVNRPGTVTLSPEQKMDILDAIAACGGTTRLASRKVEFTRKGITRTLSLEDLKRETDPTRKIWLEAGDSIDVKESTF
jgi:polysaccharide export outer membrane protein